MYLKEDFSLYVQLIKIKGMYISMQCLHFDFINWMVLFSWKSDMDKPVKV